VLDRFKARFLNIIPLEKCDLILMKEEIKEEPILNKEEDIQEPILDNNSKIKEKPKKI